MTEEQKKKRNFRQSKKWKEFKKLKKKECGGIDKITQKPLHKFWQLHHEDLDADNYQVLNDNFICLNNQTHEFIHWCFRYYINDPAIIDRIKTELDKMKKINNKGVKE